MAQEDFYVAYNVQLSASSDNSLPKDSRKKRQLLNIRLKLREVVLLKTSDETPLQENQEMDVLNALRLCDDGFAEILEDVSPPELFKSFSLSPHAYLQRFQFYKALFDMGLGGNSYSDLRDKLVKEFEAFADSQCKSRGVTRACFFTANLFVMKADFVCYEAEADMSHTRSIRSSNSGDGFVDINDDGCSSSVGSDTFN